MNKVIPTIVGLTFLFCAISAQAGLIIELDIEATPSNPLGAGVYDTTFTFTIENLGDANLLNVQIIDDLSNAFFAPATFLVVGGVSTTGGLSANGTFDGAGDMNLLVGTDSLLINTLATVSFTVQFTPNGAGTPFFNEATASADGRVTDIYEVQFHPIAVVSEPLTIWLFSLVLFPLFFKNKYNKLW